MYPAHTYRHLPRKLCPPLAWAALALLFYGCGVIKEKTAQMAHGQPYFHSMPLFDNGRFPNIVVGKKGTLIATFGQQGYQTRRSSDGGKTWEKEVHVTPQGLSGGGVTVDELTGDILAFTEDGHPPAPLRMWRSRDEGRSWEEEAITVHADQLGNLPAAHMNEKGITLTRGPHKGRLIRPSRVYAGGNDVSFWNAHYANAMYSDDRGKTWHSSEPFPVFGTGEAGLVEMANGRLYYNSRRHRSTDGLDSRWRYIAWSDDGGQRWTDLEISKVLPDGNQHSDYGLMGGLARIPKEDQDILLFSNIDVPKKDGTEDLDFEARWADRYNGTVWLSLDGGTTWPHKKVVDPGGFGYSAMVAGRPGTPTEGYVYLLYEKIEKGNYVGGHLAIFNLAWLMEP
jgi:sialidase-1